MKTVTVLLFSILLVQGIVSQEAPKGLWTYLSERSETVFRFFQLDSGEVQGEIVSKTGYTEYSPYLSQNPQFNRKQLLHRVWIKGLRWKSKGFWVDGLAVDIRNDNGNIFYCELHMSADEKTLTITSVSGLAPNDRSIVLQWKTAIVTPPGKEPVGNLQEDIWKENSDLAKIREANEPKPIFNPSINRGSNGDLIINLFTFSF